MLSKFFDWHSGSVLYFVFTRTLFSPYTYFPWLAVSLQVTDDPTRFDISNPKWDLPQKKKKKFQSGKIYALSNVERTKKVLKIKSTKAIKQVSNIINPVGLAKCLALGFKVIVLGLTRSSLIQVRIPTLWKNSLD